jgi:hypothetical protein
MRMLVLLLAACTTLPKPSAPPAAAAPEHAALLAIPDETMIFTVSFRGIQLARVLTAVGHAGEIDGHRAVIVKSGGHTEGILSMIGDLRWELTTTLDLDSATALSSVEESWGTFDGHTEHEQSHNRAGYADLHTAITLLRAWRPTSREKREVHVEIGGGRFPLEIWLGARERLRTAALRFDGIADEKFPFSIWISDDADRVPLRARVQTEWGEIGMELVEYQ